MNNKLGKMQDTRKYSSISNRKPKSGQNIKTETIEGTILLTDVDNVSISIDHNIAVMPVLDLKNITGNGIRRHGLDEIQASLLKRYCVFASIFRYKEVEQVIDFRSAHLVSRCRIGHNINDPTLYSKLAGSHKSEINGLRLEQWQ